LLFIATEVDESFHDALFTVSAGKLHVTISICLFT